MRECGYMTKKMPMHSEKEMSAKMSEHKPKGKKMMKGGKKKA